MMLIGLCAIPVFICMVGATFTFLGFVFVEGKIKAKEKNLYKEYTLTLPSFDLVQKKFIKK